ncbi:MAG: hypothetical protein CSA11_07025 [Chloroflexi bacterium]|nr:MAG: hypothetical protein CSA11_07025 [Chloroflexota bacterium]
MMRYHRLTKLFIQNQTFFRKTIFFVFINLIALLLLISCDTTQSESNNNTSASDRDMLTVSDFDFLELGMSYEEVQAHVGSADKDIGSGLYIFVYSINDEQEILLSFSSLDNLFDAQVHNLKDNTSTPLLANQ